jgi:hypothetical protein
VVNEVQLLDNLSHDLVVVKNNQFFETHIIENSRTLRHSRNRSKKQQRHFKEVIHEKEKTNNLILNNYITYTFILRLCFFFRFWFH